jgi:hypothetical protein
MELVIADSGQSARFRFRSWHSAHIATSRSSSWLHGKSGLEVLMLSLTTLTHQRAAFLSPPQEYSLRFEHQPAMCKSSCPLRGYCEMLDEVSLLSQNVPRQPRMTPLSPQTGHCQSRPSKSCSRKISSTPAHGWRRGLRRHRKVIGSPKFYPCATICVQYSARIRAGLGSSARVPADVR